MSLPYKWIYGTDLRIGDIVVMTSDPLNQMQSVRDYVKGKGGIIVDLDGQTEDLTITFGGSVTIEKIWFQRVRKATPEEARAIQLIHNVHRSV